MPIYEYRCAECGHQEEVLQKLSEAPLEQCPACQKPALKKMLSAAGFQLKGSGWYATDFKGGKKPADKGEAKAESKTDGKPEGKADAKTQTKTETKTETKTQTKTETKPAAAAAAD